MIRIKTGIKRHNRHKDIIDMSKGYRGRSNNNYSLAVERVEKGLQYAYAHRRLKKRSYRSLWIQRINAGCLIEDSTYALTISNLHNKGILLNRKILSELVLLEPFSFKSLLRSAFNN